MSFDPQTLEEHSRRLRPRPIRIVTPPAHEIAWEEDTHGLRVVENVRTGEVHRRDGYVTGEPTFWTVVGNVLAWVLILGLGFIGEVLSLGWLLQHMPVGG